MFEQGDIPQRSYGLSYLKVLLGTDKQQQKNMSPVNHVAKIKIPLQLAHDEEDERAPIEHVIRLKKHLNRRISPMSG